MTTFKHSGGKTYRYDFWWRGRRYTGSTDQLTKADADLVESDIKKRLRQQAWGIAPFDRDATPTFTAWAGVYYDAQKQRLTRPDILERTLRMVLAFFGTRPTKRDPVADGPYHNLRLADPILDPDWLQKFETWMDARGIAGATKNTYRSAVSGLYKLALRPAWRKKTHVPSNPMIGVERNATVSRQATVTVEELRAWILAAAPHVRIALAIGALAPKLRKASILALRWSDFDATLTFLTNHHHKTIRSTGKPQVVAIDPQLADILRPLRDAARKARQTHVITWRGKAIKDSRKAVKHSAQKAGLDYGRHGITFHSLRHTMATMLAELGVAEEQRRLVMGHTDIRTTQGYTHLRPLHERAPLAALSAALPIQDAVVGQVQGPPIRLVQNPAQSGRSRRGGRTAKRRR